MRRIRINAKGQVLVLVAMMMLVLVGIAAFALDVGLAYGVKAKLNAAVDAAAIAALRECTSTGNQESAATVARQYLKANFPSNTLGVAEPTCNVSVSVQDGAFVTSVMASAVVPTYFAKVVGMNGFTVTASAEATRPGMDIALVLDTTSSLYNVFPAVQTQATAFVNKFTETSDRVALVPFATGVGVIDAMGELLLTDGVEIEKSNRHFSKSAIATAISKLTQVVSAPMTAGVNSYTNSEFGLRMGVYELNKVMPPSVHKALIFFSDGAPNTFTGQFPINATGATVSGSLFSGTIASTYPPPPPSKLYRPDLTYQLQPGQTINLYKVPEKGGGNFIGTVQILPELPVTTTQRPLVFFHDNTYPAEQKCEANIAARNLMENVAKYARSRGITIYTIGFGEKLDLPDVDGYCSTAAEFGSTIMKRVANSKDSDTYDSSQPTGIFCRAASSEQLGPCFDAIGNALLRLSR